MAGTAFAQYVFHPTGYPAFPATEVPTTFALAPIGVALPPMSVPIDKDHVNVCKGTPAEIERLWITGIIVAANGMLSINALAIAESQIIIATIKYTFPPEIFPIKFAIKVKISVCSRPPTTTNNPIKNKTVL